MLDSATLARTAGMVDDVRWLTGPQAAPYLARAVDAAQSTTARLTALRRELTPERARLVMEQGALRERARAKFSRGGQMFFTTVGLEQATDEVVAAHKAARFAAAPHVFDLCAGIGGDALALGERCDVRAVDRDPAVAVLLEANARLCGERRVNVLLRDVAEVDVSECAAWHIDPDRRPGGRRTTQVALYEPGVEVIERLLARNPHAAIKLAPAATLPEGWLERAELEWIGRGRECRQLVAWFGDLAHRTGTRRATVLAADAPARTIVGAANVGPPPTGAIDRYLFEPDSAVLAADLTATLAAEHGLAAIAPGSVYLSGPAAIEDAALGCFEVQELLPFRIKPLAALLRTRGVGVLEIKKRGVDHEPEQIRRQLRLQGDESATLIVTRLGRRVVAIVAERVLCSRGL